MLARPLQEIDRLDSLCATGDAHTEVYGTGTNIFKELGKYFPSL